MARYITPKRVAMSSSKKSRKKREFSIEMFIKLVCFFGILFFFYRVKALQNRKKSVSVYMQTAVGLIQTPYSSGSDPTDPMLPYIATIRETIFEPPKSFAKNPTLNFYEMLYNNDCLPTEAKCNECIAEEGSSCQVCKDVCECYCKKLCNITPAKKFVKKHLHVSLPSDKKDPDRLIPRIVHQTWFEPVTEGKYPNMSRLINSWKQSGWEYRFYDDETAPEFLSTHFPPEVRQAYDALIPGVFKADLFRYCVLFIMGGVYVDMDVMLETNLDQAISPDVGFMVPHDSTNALGHTTMCLWNGLIASAPGHPFLGQAIEMVVNNIRNRFTAVDVENLMCPEPELSMSHKSAFMFTSGPCILGAAVNFALRRHLQTSFHSGDIDKYEEIEHNVNPIIFESNDVRSQIPGRSIILKKNIADMGANRFTWEEKNIIIAATDMPEYDGRSQEDDEEGKKYRKANFSSGIYGLEHVYTNDYIANEEIRIFVKQKSQY